MRTLLAALLLLAAGSARAFDAIEAYEPREAAGFRVLLHRDVLTHTNEAAALWTEMNRQLTVMTNVLPAAAVAALRDVRIWVEWAAKKNGGAEFHPSRGWLEKNGYHPDKAQNIEISNTRHFIDWSNRTQPCILLHEFSHAYHFIVLGADDAPIRDAYQKAKDSGRYEKVAFVTGGSRRHYALTNAKEYFAEASEAYFGRNDFHPFVREELKQFDPEGFAAIEQVWRVRPGPP